VSHAHRPSRPAQPPLPMPFMAARQPPGLLRAPETDEIAARLTHDAETRLQKSRKLIDAAKQTLTRTRPPA
jgi:hypothetical protein